MRKAVVSLCVLIVLAAVAIVALFATSTGILYHEEKSPTGASTCHYFTGIGTFTTPSYAVTGCPRFISVDRSTG
jgi:hypothetical protein